MCPRDLPAGRKLGRKAQTGSNSFNHQAPLQSHISAQNKTWGRQKSHLMFSLRKEEEKPGIFFSLAAMVFIFHQINSSLGSGCRQTPSLPARCHVCLRMWQCVGVWVLFCFLHRLCRPSPALADRSLRGSAQLHYPAGWTSHSSCYSLVQGYSPPPRTSRNNACSHPSSLGAAELPLPVPLRRCLCQGGFCRVLAWLCPLGQHQAGHQRSLPAGKHLSQKEGICLSMPGPTDALF